MAITSAEGQPTHPTLLIYELVEGILQHLDSPKDLVNMACAAQRYKDIALKTAWSLRHIDGPLVQMIHLFPGDVRNALLSGKSPSLTIPKEAFARFRYYAAFVRGIRLSRERSQENVFITEIIQANKPDPWIFPSVERLGIFDLQRLRTAGPFLSPSLQEVLVNDYSAAMLGEEEEPIAPDEFDDMRATLIQICRLPILHTLSLRLDAEADQDAAIAAALGEIVPQLSSFSATGFPLLRPLFDIVAASERLKFVSLNLYDVDERHVPFQGVIAALRTGFVALRDLHLICSVEDATEIFQNGSRTFDTVDLTITSSFSSQGLHELTNNLARGSSATLFAFDLDTSNESTPLEGGTLKDAFGPLASCRRMRSFGVHTAYPGYRMLTQKDVEELCAAWPHLRRFALHILEEWLATQFAVSYALTLQCLEPFALLCPELEQVCLPWVDCTAVVAMTKDLLPARSSGGPAVLFECALVGDVEEVAQVVEAIWPRCSLSLGLGCRTEGPHPAFHA